MITNAAAQDKIHIYELWKTAFAHDDGGYTDYFFGNLYQSSDTLTYKENGQVLSVLTRRNHDLMLGGRIIQVSFFLGVATVAPMRHHGYMHELMNAALQDAERQQLITLIQAYDPKLYEPFGFEMVYKRKKYLIERNQVQRCSLQGITTEMPNKDLMRAYAEFVRHFDGYILRDEKYFAALKNEAAAQKGQIVAYYNAQKQIEGYAVLYPASGGILVQEMIYKSSVALIKLLNVAFRMSSRVVLFTSDAEHIEKVIPNAEAETISFMMARVNDYEMFNRFYGKNVKTVREAFAVSKKPLFIHEYA